VELEFTGNEMAEGTDMALFFEVFRESNPRPLAMHYEDGNLTCDFAKV
jgi:hypothetical protein